MKDTDASVSYVIAKGSLKDESSKIIFGTEAVVALMMQSFLHGTTSVHKQEDITTIIFDKMHNRSSQSDSVLALALATMQNLLDKGW